MNDFNGFERGKQETTRINFDTAYGHGNGRGVSEASHIIPRVNEGRIRHRTILLDGLWGNATRLSLMKRRLEASGLRQVEIFSYNNSGFACLEGEGRRLANFVAAQNEPVNLMGYSMGGLVIRSAVNSRNNLPVRKVAFLNTPHQGSLLARWLPGVGISQMQPGCAFLQRLDAAEWSHDTLVVWTPGDLMVLPARSACWSRAKKITSCRVPAHVWPLVSWRLHRDLAEFFLSE